MNKYANDGFNEQLLASSNLAEKSIRVLKHDETFGIFDRYGDILRRPEGEQGMFHAGTRFLSRSELFINQKKPLLLSSYINEDNASLQVDFTNPDMEGIPSGALHITRSIFLWNGVKNETLNFFNYLDCGVRLEIELYCGRLPRHFRNSRALEGSAGCVGRARHRWRGFDPSLYGT
jgi:hypothetical protein